MHGGQAVMIGDAALAAAIGATCASRPVPGAGLTIAPPHLLDEALAAGGPVMLLDAPDCPLARATLLDRGAVEVAAAGIAPVELAAKVRALLRATGGRHLACGDLAIDPIDRVATRAGRPLPLHPREFAVLLRLARARGAAVSRATLYAAVWGRAFDPGTNVVAVTVSRLRAKLQAGGGAVLLQTDRDGYRLAAEVAAPAGRGQDVAT